MGDGIVAHHLMKTLILLTILLLHVAGSANPYRSVFGEIDESPALRIDGRLEFSQYIVEKNLARDIALGDTEAMRVADSPQELNAWIDVFLDRCMLVKLAIESGLADHPEVVWDVGVMSRYMIANPRSQGYPVLLERIHGSLVNRSAHIDLRTTQLAIQYDTKSIQALLLGSAKDEEILARYSDGTVSFSNFRVKDFKKARSFFLWQPKMDNEEELKLYLRDLLIEQRDYQDAQKLGFTNDLKFLADQKNYLHRRVVVELQKQLEHAAKSAPIQKIEQFYQARNVQYAWPESVTVQTFRHQSLVEVLKARSSIGGLGLLLQIDARESTDLDVLLPLLSRTSIGMWTEPVSRSDGFYIYHILAKTGSFIPELDRIRQRVINDYAIEAAISEMDRLAKNQKTISKVEDLIDREKLVAVANVFADTAGKATSANSTGIH